MIISNLSNQGEGVHQRERSNRGAVDGKEGNVDAVACVIKFLAQRRLRRKRTKRSRRLSAAPIRPTHYIGAEEATGSDSRNALLTLENVIYSILS